MTLCMDCFHPVMRWILGWGRGSFIIDEVRRINWKEINLW